MKNLFFSLFIATFLFTSCKHDDGVPLAGKGGYATLQVLMKHHEDYATLDTCRVYIKYNTLNAPADSVYDDSIVCPQINQRVTGAFTGLKNGQYYLYAKGFDFVIQKGVRGGGPYVITSQSIMTDTIRVGEE